MTSSTSDDGKVVTFPPTAEERKALRKAKQSVEQQKLVDQFVDEAGDDALFATADGVAYADLIVAGHRETWPVRSKQFRFAYIKYLKRQFKASAEAGALAALGLGMSLKKSAVNNAIDDFEMRAQGASTIREVHVRVAADGDNIYVDLGDPTWHAVRVTAMGWAIVQSPPVRFRRSTGMLPLPFPERGTSIDKLRPLINIDDRDFVLTVAWLLAALRPRGPYPILALIGEQGSCKTSFIRLLRNLIDPSSVPSSALPFSGRDLFIAAHNALVQAFENVSKLTPAMSDHLCQLATGGGIRLRAMYKDIDETLLRAARPVLMEGIANFITRPDLMDRAVVLALDPLPERKTDAALRAEFERLHPGILGALLDHLVTGIRQLPDTDLVNPPRMADFTTWAVACGLADFEAAYSRNRQAAIDTSLEHDSLAGAIRALMAKRKQWTGSATELRDLLGDAVQIKDPKVLSENLRRLAPLLRTVDVDLRFHHGHAKRGITITRLA